MKAFSLKKSSDFLRDSITYDTTKVPALPLKGILRSGILLVDLQRSNFTATLLAGFSIVNPPFLRPAPSTRHNSFILATARHWGAQGKSHEDQFSSQPTGFFTRSSGYSKEAKRKRKLTHRFRQQEKPTASSAPNTKT